MGEMETKKEETVEAPSELAQPPTPPAVEGSKDIAEEKTVIAPPPPPPPEEKEKIDDSKSLSVVQKVSESMGERSTGASNDRDAALARLEVEKRLALIKAWEESEKTKAENKAHKKLSAIGSWENSKKAVVEAKLKKIEEKLEKKKAEYVEKMKNEVALIHKEAEEKRAMVEAKRGEDLLKAKEMSAKYRASGNTPKTMIGCFGG